MFKDEVADQFVKNAKDAEEFHKRFGELDGKVSVLAGYLQAITMRLDALEGKTTDTTKNLDALRQETEAAKALFSELKAAGSAMARFVALCAEGRNSHCGGTAAALTPAVTEPSVDVSALAKWASNTEQSGLNEDRGMLGEHAETMRQWRERSDILRGEIQSVADEFTKLMTEAAAKAQSLLDRLPPEMRDSLDSRQKGLDLTAKMLRNRAERAGSALASGEQPSMEMPTVGQERWSDVAAGEPDRARAGEAIKKELKRIAMERYQVITQVRDAGGKCRKSFLNFTGKHLLPVLDSVDDGEKYSRSLVKEVKDKLPDAAEEVDAWFQTYGILRRGLQTVLEKAGVRPIEVKVGGKVDYERHETLDVEADPNLENDQIKSVASQGYEYDAEEGKVFVLRPAQVVVVRNKKE